MIFISNRIFQFEGHFKRMDERNTLNAFKTNKNDLRELVLKELPEADFYLF